MAFLFSDTFLKADDDGKKLLRKVRDALGRLSGDGGKSGKRDLILGFENDQPVFAPQQSGFDYVKAPKRLQTDRDFLKFEWRQIWRECTIQFDSAEAGASILVPRRRIRIGPFFLDDRFVVADMEKVILHEYLHAALAIEERERGMQHNFMKQIITFNLNYSGNANPAGCD